MTWWGIPEVERDSRNTKKMEKRAKLIPLLRLYQANPQRLCQAPIYCNRLNSTGRVWPLCMLSGGVGGKRGKKRKKAITVKYQLDFIKELSFLSRTTICNCIICHTTVSSFAFILFFLQWAGKLSCFSNRLMKSAWWTAEGISTALKNYINQMLSDCHFPAKCYYK